MKRNIRLALVGAMTQAEARKGRYMRAPDHPTQGATGDNQSGGAGEMSGAGGSGDSGQNNAGDQFDPAAFWDGPAPAGEAAPSGESAGNAGGESGNGGDDNFAQQITGQLSSMQFDAVFDDKIAAEINEGNYTGVQERFNAMGQAVVRQALAMQVQILKPFAEQLLAQVRAETTQTFNSRDNVTSLETLFPAAKDPVMAKTIQPIYDQALKNAKGDRAQAVNQTKEMLRYMAGASAKDLNLDIGQADSSNPRRVSSNYNWLDELSGR
jgi:hypothetical protein